MVLYKTFVQPTELPGFIKNEDGTALRDYGLLGFIRLDNTYSEVYLKHIRFIYSYPKSKEGVFPHPMQLHLKWYDNVSTQFQPGLILQNTMNHANPDAILIYPFPKSTDTPNYSTFVEVHVFEETKEPLEGQTRWIFYSMTRDALLKTGNISYLQFEIFLTDLDGARIYRYLPNIEIEFDVF
jgi:hypothetical protein